MSRDIFHAAPVVKRLIYQTVFAVIPRLPMRPSQFLGQLIGEVVAFVDRGRRRVARNLAPLLQVTLPTSSPSPSHSHSRSSPQSLSAPVTPSTIGHARPRRIAHHDLDWWVRRNYRRFCQGMFEQLHLDRIPQAWKSEPGFKITDPWRVLGDPTDGQAVPGPGVYVMPHCNWELIPALLQGLGKFPTIDAIALSHDDEAIDALFDQVRSRVGIRTHLLQKSPLSSLRALQQGATFGLIGDRDYTRHGIQVSICGQVCSLPVGPAAMAVQAKVPLHPVVLFRNGHSRFHIFYGKPITIDPTLNKREAVRAITQASARWYERPAARRRSMGRFPSCLADIFTSRWVNHNDIRSLQMTFEMAPSQERRGACLDLFHR